MRRGGGGAGGSSEGGVAATSAAVLKPPSGGGGASAAGLASLGWRRASKDASSLPDEAGVVAGDVFGFFCVGVGMRNRRVLLPRFFIAPCSQVAQAQSRSRVVHSSTALRAALDGSIKFAADKRRFALRDGELPTAHNICSVTLPYGEHAELAPPGFDFRASVTEVLGLSQPLNSFAAA